MTTENTAFSTSGADAITRELNVQLDTTADSLSSPTEFNNFYEIDRTVREIEDGDFKRIALQFPDELLHDSVPIFRSLKRRIGRERELYVLADTSYGSCCVDEVAAQHVDADVMVHYGYACMSQTYRLPVIYVFGKKSIDVEDCVGKFVDVFSSHSKDGDGEESNRRGTIVFRHDVVFTHQAEQIVTKLRTALQALGSQVLYDQVPTKLLPSPPSAPSSNNDNASSDPPTSHGPPIQDCTVFYLGDESLGLTNLLMTHSTCDVFTYSPTSKTSRYESARTNKLLMRRYAVVQKAKDADVFGILVGTLGVASYLPLIKHIRNILAASHKKSYTISVGKLNPAKLANFMEIECFVLVACPENSLIDAKDFYRPIITPYELEIALRAEHSWTGRYVLDFEQLLAEHDESQEPSGVNGEGGDDYDDEQPVFSLVTGKYRHAKRFGAAKINANTDVPPDAATSAVALRNQENSLSLMDNSAAGQFFQTRSYQGLEMRLGEDTPSTLEQGRSGIARGYGGNADEGKT